MALRECADAAQQLHAERLARLVERERKLVEEREAFILKEAALDLELEEKHRELADLGVSLNQQKMSQADHEDELTIREGKLESALKTAEEKF